MNNIKHQFPINVVDVPRSTNKIDIFYKVRTYIYKLYFNNSM